MISGKIKLRVLATTQTSFSINTKKMSVFDQLSINFARAAQWQDSALPLEFLKKAGGFGAEFIWKREKFLKNLTHTDLKKIGLQLGKT